MNTLFKITFIVLLTAGAALAQAETPPAGELQKAIEMYRQGATEQAIKTLEGLSKIKNYADAGTVQNYLGLAYLDKDDFKKARKALSKAVELKPQSAVIRANLALAYLRSNKLNTAQDEAEKALRLDAQLYTAYYVRGTAYLFEGKYTEAEADADRAIAAHADFPPAYNMKAEVLVARFGNRITQGGTPKGELALLQKAVETLETCAANCKTGDGMSLVNEKLESLKVFYDYFERDDQPQAATPINTNDPNKLKILGKPRANYTDQARQARVSGTVTIAALFAANGKVTHAIIIKPLGYGLDQQALRAARGIQFSPAVKDGKPVSVVKMVEYTFTIY